MTFREVVKFVVIVMNNRERQNSEYFSVCHSWWTFDVLNRHSVSVACVRPATHELVCTNTFHYIIKVFTQTDAQAF